MWRFWLVLLLVCHAPSHVRGGTMEEHPTFQFCLTTPGPYPGCTSLSVYNDADLTGTLPTELGLMTWISSLWLQGNPQLTGTIPTEIGRLTQITSSIWFYGNPLLTGPIPTEFGLLTACASLEFHRCDLTGTIPTEFAQLAALGSFYVYSNPRLCGPLASVGTFGTTYGSHGSNINGDWNNDPLAYTNLGNPCPAPPPPPPTAAPTDAPSSSPTASPSTAPSTAPSSSPTETDRRPCCEKLRQNAAWCCIEARHPELARNVCQECGTGK